MMHHSELCKSGKRNSLEARGEEREKLDIVCTFGFSHLFQVGPRNTHTHACTYTHTERIKNKKIGWRC